ncbi:MAG TPA: response regulator transcription factor, partial [Roseiflexaceae bacterium]|nr:response regulator transcription factor [Roseiflexaceae bacterium]
MMPRVLIVDDHPPIRDWVARTLLPHGVTVVEAQSGQDALDRLDTLLPLSLAICDLAPSQGNDEGSILARTLWYERHIPCLVLAGPDDAAARLETLYAGAFGFLAKNCATPELLVSCVLALLDGQPLPSCARNLAPSVVEACAIAERRAAERRAREHLTPQQRVVAGLIQQGKTNQEIAAQLVLSRGTVNSHVSNILHRLNLETRRQVKQRVLLLTPGDAAHSVALTQRGHS